MDVDVSLAWLPFELDAIDASDELLIGHVRVPVARPEDLVIYKAVAWRPQDQQDVERLLSLHGERMDLVRVRRVVAELAAALDEPERAAELERVIDHALKSDSQIHTRELLSLGLSAARNPRAPRRSPRA